MVTSTALGYGSSASTSGGAGRWPGGEGVERAAGSGGGLFERRNDSSGVGRCMCLVGGGALAPCAVVRLTWAVVGLPRGVAAQLASSASLVVAGPLAWTGQWGPAARRESSAVVGEVNASALLARSAADVGVRW